jgi:hypothetical protein
VLAVHGGNIIQPVNERNYLVVRKILRMLLEATVQVPDMRHHLPDNLSVHQYFQSQYAMRRRMLRTKVNDHLLCPQIIGPELVGLRQV